MGQELRIYAIRLGNGSQFWNDVAMPYQIALAKTDAEIERCSGVMRQLRPHIAAAEFLPRVQRQLAQGYRLGVLQEHGEIKAVAGYRILECLAWGKFLYVDDLVTRETDRSTGCGGALIDWLIAEAIREDCDEFHLDSGVQRFRAHRFYLAKRLDITCHHFALKLRG